MRVLLVTVGSAGDVNPFLAVGKALRARGHETAVLVNPYFAKETTAAGLAFLPLGEESDLLRFLHSPDLMHRFRGPLLALRAFGEAAEPVFGMVDAALASFRPDVVLRHFICAGARWACERRGVPCASAALAPAHWFSAHERRTWHSPALASLQEAMGRLQLLAGRAALGWIIGSRLRRASKRLAIGPERDLLGAEWLGGAAVLGLWSPAFRAPMPDDPPRSVVCGFPWFDATHTGPDATPEAVAFATEGDPPIVFSLGTAAVHTPRDFYACAAEACSLLGRRGLLLGADPTSGGRPPAVRALPYARFSEVLPLACATVHHGGIGSTAQALRSGKPMVVVPLAYDQPDNGKRVRRLGVAASVPMGRLSADRLAAALRSVLDDPEVARRAADIGRRVRSDDGATAAAVAVERITGAGARS